MFNWQHSMSTVKLHLWEHNSPNFSDPDYNAYSFSQHMLNWHVHSSNARWCSRHCLYLPVPWKITALKYGSLSSIPGSSIVFNFFFCAGSNTNTSLGWRLVYFCTLLAPPPTHLSVSHIFRVPASSLLAKLFNTWITYRWQFVVFNACKLWYVYYTFSYLKY